MTDAIDRALAELHRRKEQQEAFAESHGRQFKERHENRASTYQRSIDILSDAREPDTTADTGVTVNTDELSIVESTDAGHRRRTYRAAPDTPGVDARLEVSRWSGDGWRVVGEEPIAQFVVNGERIFE